MKSFAAFFLCFFGLAGAVPAVAAEAVAYGNDFEGGAVLAELGAAQNPNVRISPGYQGSQSLEIDARKGVANTVTVPIPLALEKIRGERLKCEAFIKADGVSAPPKPWNGIKCMLHIVTPDGQEWPQLKVGSGSFDWQKFQARVAIPANATKVELVLGLEQVNGRVWFDDVKISTVPRPAATPAAGPAYTGHDGIPRLRGAMIGTGLKEADFITLGRDWGANHVRWQLLWNGFPHSPADNGDLAAYDAWLEGELKRLDGLLPVCEKLGIKVLIDLHTPPGGRTESLQCRIFADRNCQEKFLELWNKIAQRYKGNRTVWGYDLLNEPAEGALAEGLMNWQELVTEAAKNVRKIDPGHAIIVEPIGGDPNELENLDPLPVPDVVYSVHMYLPHAFTHQGVYGTPTGRVYPGKIDGREWNKETLRKALQPVREFQKKYGVHIYIGEFSAIRWAPDDSACRYLSDCIDIFEENGWDWAYHAYREWSGWSVEYGPDPKDNAPSKTRTSREQLLRAWFAKNRTGTGG